VEEGASLAMFEDLPKKPEARAITEAESFESCEEK